MQPFAGQSMGVTQPGNNACGDGNHDLCEDWIPFLSGAGTVPLMEMPLRMARLLQWKVHADEPEVHKIRGESARYAHRGGWLRIMWD